MSQFTRGKVVRISFTVEYPDGSSHESELASPEEITKVVFHESELAEDEHSAFCVSLKEWKRNPSMLVFRGRGQKGIHPEPHCSHIDHELS